MKALIVLQYIIKVKQQASIEVDVSVGCPKSVWQEYYKRAFCY